MHRRELITNLGLTMTGIALVNGTPAIYVRQPSDTIKGQMYYDLKLDDWIFEIEAATGEQIAGRVIEILNSWPESFEKVKLLNQRVKSIYDRRMEEFTSILNETFIKTDLK